MVIRHEDLIWVCACTNDWVGNSQVTFITTVTLVIVHVIYLGALTFSLLQIHILGIQIVLGGKIP